ncbi:ribonuclease P protein subunit p21 [Gouania willdenowi]|uniref:Ribonuclease P protein subunit p21-like n=1 Tax=Gouania willdenowi TaxID=441366 RepID=A0A8C5N876_GOUWI|nr:ribonuclease P protein subunit p21-like [Gouania willdenowi]
MAQPLKDKEAYQRLNYLYQAAHCVLSQNPKNVELARFYCFTQKTIARRLVIRQDPSVKRTLCKNCSSLLIPGVTATIRQRKKKGRTRFTVIRCLSCGQSKSFLNNPDYCLWADRPEAKLEQRKPPEPGSAAKNRPKNKNPDGSQSSKTRTGQNAPST